MGVRSKNESHERFVDRFAGEQIPGIIPAGPPARDTACYLADGHLACRSGSRHSLQSSRSGSSPFGNSLRAMQLITVPGSVTII